MAEQQIRRTPSPEKFKVAIGPLSQEIARRIHPDGGGGAKRISDETRGRQFLVIDVASREIRCANADLAGLRNTRELACTIEHEQLNAIDAMAQRNNVEFISRGHDKESHRLRCFRGAVEVDAFG